MIFVTVGTHEQPFDRLIESIDNIKRDGIIMDDVVIQTGYSTYQPQYCDWKKLYPFEQMEKYVNEARIVITHGGPSSFLMPLQRGKIPIVVPRQKRYGEHVNDHQVSFALEVEKRNKTIITVLDIESLREIVVNYDSIVGKMSRETGSNNAKFNLELSKIVKEILR